jgi:hypothetical protein
MSIDSKLRYPRMKLFFKLTIPEVAIVVIPYRRQW